MQLFYRRLAQSVAMLPELRAIAPTVDQRTFEQDLEAGIERVAVIFPPNEG